MPLPVGPKEHLLGAKGPGQGAGPRFPHPHPRPQLRLKVPGQAQRPSSPQLRLARGSIAMETGCGELAPSSSVMFRAAPPPSQEGRHGSPP